MELFIDGRFRLPLARRSSRRAVVIRVQGAMTRAEVTWVEVAGGRRVLVNWSAVGVCEIDPDGAGGLG